MTMIQARTLECNICKQSFVNIYSKLELIKTNFNKTNYIIKQIYCKKGYYKT